MTSESVILVDEFDAEIGIIEKLEAHKKGILHRAFSVFIFNNQNKFLLQRRALHKYHSGGLWTNTCCSHPRPGETILNAAKRRLYEEMGIKADLTIRHKFIYKAAVENGLIEHELDYIITGVFNDEPIINNLEVTEYKWVDLKVLVDDIEKNPQFYTTWFKLILKKYLTFISV